MKFNDPLTDELIEDLAQFEPDLNEFLKFNRSNDMRAAADWQLEQVKQKVENEIKVWRRSGYTAGADAVEDFFEGIMQELRPQEDNQ